MIVTRDFNMWALLNPPDFWDVGISNYRINPTKIKNLFQPTLLTRNKKYGTLITHKAKD